MRRLEGVEGLAAAPLREPVCTLGIFDGIHRGHREIFYELRTWADSVNGEACILTFREHPVEVLKGVSVPLLMTFEQRLLEFERHGIDAVLILDFRALKDLGPEEFLTRVVRDGVGSRRLLLGFDSHIGKDRAGDATTLPAIGARVGVEVRIGSRVLDRGGDKIGSSAIRAAIRSGDIESAENMLGHPLVVRGEVIHGAGRGRALGIATANLEIAERVLPPDGVYLVRVFLESETAPAIANLGIRPTFGEAGPRFLEVHLPGWDRNLYGETLEVRLVRFVRPERKFESAEALREQITADLKELAQAVESGEI